MKARAEEIARVILREDEASRWPAMHDRLVAEASEVARAGRKGVYDVRVTNQKGELVALFRGKSATVKGVWIE